MGIVGRRGRRTCVCSWRADRGCWSRCERLGVLGLRIGSGIKYPPDETAENDGSDRDPDHGNAMFPTAAIHVSSTGVSGEALAWKCHGRSSLNGAGDSIPPGRSCRRAVAGTSCPGRLRRVYFRSSRRGSRQVEGNAGSMTLASVMIIGSRKSVGPVSTAAMTWQSKAIPTMTVAGGRFGRNRS